MDYSVLVLVMCFITELCTWRANFASYYGPDCHPCQVGGLLNPAVSAIPEINKISDEF